MTETTNEDWTGTPVIVNEYDKPSGDLVAVVVHAGEETLLCSYLNSASRLAVYGTMRVRVDRVRSLHDFGVALRVDGGVYWCEPVSESKATYPDGSTRRWQEFEPTRYSAKREVLSCLRNVSPD